MSDKLQYKDIIFKNSQKEAGMNLSHHPTSAALLRVTNTKMEKSCEITF